MLLIMMHCIFIKNKHFHSTAQMGGREGGREGVTNAVLCVRVDNVVNAGRPRSNNRLRH